MTFILSLINNEFSVQVSDRRLTNPRRNVISDESCKCGVVLWPDARLSFAYTGIANRGNFSTKKWLLHALHSSAAPDYSIHTTLERLKENATNTFRSNQVLRQVPKKQKRLAVVFSGYLFSTPTSTPVYAVLSNYHNFIDNTESKEAAEEFTLIYYNAPKGVANPTLVKYMGNWSAVNGEDIIGLRKLLLGNKPKRAIVNKAIAVIRDISNRPKSSGTIGKQIASIAIPEDMTNLGIESTYSTTYTKRETYMPAMVYLCPDMHLTVSKMSITPVEDDTPPCSIPQVCKNAPCPCGSKKKYKYCHGGRLRKNDPCSCGSDKKYKNCCGRIK
jgi:hypothetical protein